MKILMVEDSRSLTSIYRAYLEKDGYQIAAVDTLAKAHGALGAFLPDLVLLDIELPDGNGLDLLRELKQMERSPEVVVMTAHGTSDMAVQAIQAGAFDFITKPFDGTRLRVTVENAVEHLQLGGKVKELAAMEKENYEGFIGASPVMQSVYRTISSMADSQATAFIVGESGTGKELAAEAIHAQSKRSSKEFLAINCAAIPGELMESELFGHVKGAFTGAGNNREGAVQAADGGTLFLDEICEMDLELQSKLLRFIQTGTFRKVGSNALEQVDVRFVCATNRDPVEEVRAGRFREDLFYRLHVIPIRMPALRERGEDIIRIASHFLKDFANKEGKNFVGLSADTADALSRYAWPGNVRQLQNVIHQAVVLNDSAQVEVEMLPDNVVSGDISRVDIAPPAPVTAAPAPSLNQTQEARTRFARREIEPLWLVEKTAVMAAIEACDGNINRAAGLLEVVPSTIYRKLQAWEKQRIAQ